MSIKATVGGELQVKRAGTSAGEVAMLALILVAAASIFGLRFSRSTQVGVSNDDAVYVVLAESFATGRPYRRVNDPAAPLETVWPPGYPLIALAPVWALTDGDLTALRLTSPILLLLGLVLLWRLLRDVTTPRFMWPVLTLTALNPSVAGHAAAIMAEALFVPATFLGLIGLRWVERGGSGGSDRDGPGDADSAGRRRAQGRLSENAVVRAAVVGLVLFGVLLIRYQGLALIAAGGLWLLMRRRWREALTLGFVVGMGVAIFAAFLAAGGIESASDVALMPAIISRVLSMGSTAPTLMLSYSRAISHGLIPLVGPGLESLLIERGAGWAVWLITTGVVFMVVIGWVDWIRRRSVIALFALWYFALLLAITGRVEGHALFDEPRYIVPMIPWLYLFFFTSLHLFIERVSEWRLPVAPRVLKTAPVAITVALAVLLVARNVRSAQTVFDVPDLATGAEWVQENAPVSAIIMTLDPVSRYVHLGRRTVDIPTSTSAGVFACGVISDADYVLVAPPLTNQRAANKKRVLSEHQREVILPTLRKDSEHFSLAWSDEGANAWIFAVESREGLDCPVDAD